MCTIDLQDAYLLVPIHDDHKKYLRFEFEGTTYEFNCLPFGLSSAPYVFTKLLRPVMTYLRSREILSVIYLDDLFCVGDNAEECFKNALFAIKFLERLGFIINYKKSNLTPSHICRYLGLIIDSKSMKISLPTESKPKFLAYFTPSHSTNRRKSSPLPV